ncbi:ORF6C domain-containing protein, partial [Lactococcus lactis]
VVGNRAPKLYLWTEKGALLHAKSLGTDEAWDMYDILVDTYFKVQEQQVPLTLDQQIAAIATGYGSVKEELVEVKDRVSDLEENAPLSAGEYNYIGSRITQRVNEVAHGYSSITQKQRGELYKDINRGVKVVTGISTRTQLRAKHFDTAMDFINNWEPSTATKMQLRQT